MLESIFGLKDHLTMGQECARAVLVFFYGLVMLRLSGRRTFREFSAIDLVISIMVGSSLSRAMTGGAPLAGTLLAVAVLVGLHLLFAFGTAYSPRFSRWVEGRPIVLARDGHILESERLISKISLADLDATLRGKGLDGLADLAKTRELVLEPSGRISVIPKQA